MEKVSSQGSIRSGITITWSWHVVEHLQQHSTAQPAMHKAAKRVRADQSATTQASRQSLQEPACRRVFAARCVLKTDEESKSTRPKKNNHKQLLPVMRERFAFICFQSQYDTTFFFSFAHIRMMHACGVRVVFLEHGPLGICKSSFCTYLWTYARFINLVFFYSFLISERSGRKPPAERTALYIQS